MQTYLNWLLNELYEINPMVADEAMPELSQIRDIVVRDTVINPSTDSQSANKRSAIDLTKAALNSIIDALSDTKDISTHELEQMISAKLVIEFRKPKKDDDEKIKKAFGALLKPVADLDNFEFTTRNNKKIIKGKKILRTKEVSIETTDSGHLIESQISQQMALLLRDLDNERKKTANS